MHIDTKMTWDYTINIEQPIAQMQKGAKNNRDNAKIMTWKRTQRTCNEDASRL